MFKQAYFAHTMLYVFMDIERGRINTLGRFITIVCHGGLTKDFGCASVPFWNYSRVFNKTLWIRGPGEKNKAIRCFR